MQLLESQRLKDHIRLYKERVVYWKNMLCQEKKLDREYIQVYDDLYDYGKI